MQGEDGVDGNAFKREIRRPRQSSLLQFSQLVHDSLHMCAPHRFVKALMRDAGLEVREDAMGNIFGRLAGSQDKGAA